MKPTNDKDLQHMAWAASLIQDAQIKREYCQITVNIENGRITRAVKTTSIHPPEAGATPRQTGY
ncbi:hypothetical protein ACFSC6_12225 [Rufibacter sediminis]|uniref:Uncharacterized protein n=1 Tax=Rufibacter sediminis TaxID=2762756 RepID=A0ABR6VTY2_9BACT|nr:hypothetical protein [Rufibacter sediminis]MBC3540649.1 hypothetical protein [Rufibacter sediminis]